ncbi:cupin domain-containing protein [Pedobacter sp. SYSU D00535]|uniref:cupin domain-containing protein n=1 Tax=Pedobacter sp. SYSU D00535 TaxID=2810308 RepID=UPI001A96527C|nr:cupin domain-containing protein [Pedobacter sp. SYSU D00535]
MNNIPEVIHGHITKHILEQDGSIPNNPKLPVIIYKGALRLHPDEGGDFILDLFSKNNWTNGWKGGVYDYDHYHSVTHEVLAVTRGTADVILGGPAGVCIELTRGDVLVIPAGVSHRNSKSSEDFLCVGAYPEGADYDLKYGKEEELDLALRSIPQVPVPTSDPVYGEEGPVLESWTL